MRQKRAGQTVAVAVNVDDLSIVADSVGGEQEHIRNHRFLRYGDEVLAFGSKVWNKDRVILRQNVTEIQFSQRLRTAKADGLAMEAAFQIRGCFTAWAK